MDLETELLRQINDSTLSCSERAWLRCELAKKLEEAGNYDAAQDALGELWLHMNEHPQVSGLDTHTQAEVLLRVGVLWGWVGSTRQVEGAQERAKNLITQSISIFETLYDTKKVAEALIDLGCCYWREGALDEARVVLKDALDRLGDIESDLRALALLRSAGVEKDATRYSDALRIHNENAPHVEASDNHALKGKFHNEVATILGILGAAEHREDYTDRAILEYTAASFHFEQAGHRRYRACVESNLGTFCFDTGRFSEAHDHLIRARRLFVDLKNAAHLAQVDETHARVFLAEDKNVEAERIVREAVRALETGGEQRLLAEALTTHGTALARTGDFQHARLTLERAIIVAEQSGNLEGAGQAVLTLIEELGEWFAPADLSALFERAAEFLRTSQHPGIITRLNDCARRVLYVITPQFTQPVTEQTEKFIPPTNWDDISFWGEVERYEAFLIKRAFKDARGVITRAAALLGLAHQSLNTLLKEGRHKDLLPLRTPPEPRRQSIARTRTRRSRSEPGAGKTIKPLSILHVEDNDLVANGVKEMLTMEGWRVEMCADGALALDRLTSHAHYDVIILDNELPNVNGLELAHYARHLPHRRETPIIMLSASENELEARRAGANAFLGKLEDIGLLVGTINQLLQ
ncbi:MAG: response regulator [Pyrinomonadaceae bacterium]